MDMTIQQYEELIERLETMADENPRGYRLRVFGLAIGAYAYIFFVLAILLAGIVIAALLLTVSVALGVGLGIFLLTFVWYTLRALWVRTGDPEGRRLQRSEAPRLFDEIEAIRTQMNAPRLHEVIVVPEFNAAIQQVPRLGVFGWYKNVLHIGLPLLSLLSPEEFRAVVAHEFGHLSGKHSWFTLWVYRLRATWSRLLEAFDTVDQPSLLFGHFFRRFAPYFDAYTYVLARTHEYEADAASARLAGNEAAGRALIKSTIGGQFLEEEFWPQISHLNDHREEPPRELYVEMNDQLSECAHEEDAEVWLETGLARNPGLSDTHPSLAQRLEALEVEPDVPEPIEVSAADEYLGSKHEALARVFSEEWYRLTGPQWGYFYDQAQAGMDRLAELRAIDDEGELEDEQQWEFLLLRERFEEDAEMLAEYRAYLADHPEHEQASFAVGRLLLDNGEEEGIGLLRRACELNERLTLDACELVMGFLFNEGRRSEAQPWLDRYNRFAEKARKAQVERSYVDTSDQLIPHSLDKDVLADLIAQLEAMPGIREAYLVEKAVEHFPDAPLYILAILPESGRFLGNGDPELIQRLAQAVQFPFEMLIYDVAESNSKFIKKKVRKIANARLL